MPACASADFVNLCHVPQCIVIYYTLSFDTCWISLNYNTDFKTYWLYELLFKVCKKNVYISHILRYCWVGKDFPLWYIDYIFSHSPVVPSGVDRKSTPEVVDWLVLLLFSIWLTEDHQNEIDRCYCFYIWRLVKVYICFKCKR